MQIPRKKQPRQTAAKWRLKDNYYSAITTTEAGPSHFQYNSGALPAHRRCFNLDIYTSRQRQLVQSVDRLASWLNNVNQSLVSPNLKLLTRLFVDVRATQNSVALNSSWQRDWAMHYGAGPLGGIDDIRSGLIQYRMVVCFHPDADAFLVRRHRKSSSVKGLRQQKIPTEISGVGHVSSTKSLCQ